MRLVTIGRWNRAAGERIGQRIDQLYNMPARRVGNSRRLSIARNRQTSDRSTYRADKRPCLSPSALSTPIYTETRVRPMSMYSRPMGFPAGYPAGYPRRPGGPLKGALILCGLVFGSIGVYTAYQVGWNGETVFIPLWITARQRGIYSCEVDKTEVVQAVREKLHERLSVDETVNSVMARQLILSESVTFRGSLEEGSPDLNHALSPSRIASVMQMDPSPQDGLRDEELRIVASNFGVAGLCVVPQWRLPRFQIRLFSFGSGFDDFLQPVSGPQAIDLKNGNANQTDSLEPDVESAELPNDMYNVIVSGHVMLNHTASGCSAKVVYCAAKNVRRPQSTPRFLKTCIEYKDEKGETVEQRLW